jgi:uncharacterized protein YbjT (DUF2867 family)
MQQAGAVVLNHNLRSGEALSGVRASSLVHLAGIRHAEAALALAQHVSADHIVAISSASATAPSHPDRVEIVNAERRIRQFPAPVAILRPTMIYGSARDRNVRRLYRLVQRIPRVPHFAGGGRVMPVFVDDLARAIGEAVDERNSFVRPVGGPTPVTLGEIVDELCRALHRPRFPMRVPVRPAARLAGGVAHGRWKSLHALQMLGVDRVVESPKDVGFGYEPTSLARGIDAAVRRYASRSSRL